MYFSDYKGKALMGAAAAYNKISFHFFLNENENSIADHSPVNLWVLDGQHQTNCNRTFSNPVHQRVIQ